MTSQVSRGYQPIRTDLSLQGQVPRMLRQRFDLVRDCVIRGIVGERRIDAERRQRERIAAWKWCDVSQRPRIAAPRIVQTAEYSDDARRPRQCHGVVEP